MNLYWLRFSATLTAFFLVASFLQAQSTIIAPYSNSGPNNIRDVTQESQPRNSLNARQMRWERILKNPSNAFVGSMRCDEMLRRLRQIGLPVELDQSARDDSLIETDVVQFQNANQPLYESLAQALLEYNATLAMIGNRLSIISKDVAGDPQYFTTITYDVTGLAEHTEHLAENIKSAIAPDDWYDTNGDGSLDITRQGNREYMTISQHYEVHHELREMLAGLVRLQGSIATAQSRTTPAMMESQIIRLPVDDLPFGSGGSSGGFGGGGFGGGGIGGFGTGGGVF